MDFSTIIIGIAVIIAFASFAKWYQKQHDNDTIDYDFENYEDSEEQDLREMDLGLDDRIRDMINPPEPETDEDPYGEQSNHDSYRATLINRGTEDQK